MEHGVGVPSSTHFNDVDRRRDALSRRVQRVMPHYLRLRSVVGMLALSGGYLWALRAGEQRVTLGIVSTVLLMFVVNALPYDGVAHVLVLRRNGGRVRRVFNRPFGVFLREDSGWRLTRTTRAFLDPFVLPTSDSLARSFTRRVRTSWGDVLAMSFRAVAELSVGVVTLMFTSLPTMAWLTFLAIGTVHALATSVNAVWIALDQRIARGGERPVDLAQRDAVLCTRVALTEGVRPSDLAAQHLDALLAPQRAGLALARHMCVLRAMASLTAAQILADCGHHEEAVGVLRQSIGETAPLPREFQRELYAVLGDLLVWLGADSTETREAWQRSDPQSRLPYERDAYLAMVAARSGNSIEARQLAQSALQLLSAPLFPGLAHALRDDLHALLAHLERGEIAAGQPFVRVTAATC